MSGYGNARVTLIRPHADDGLDPDRDERDEIEVDVWLKNITGAQTSGIFGQFSTNVYICRFSAPADIYNKITTFWRVRDADGNEYVIKGASRTNGLYNLTLELA